MKKLMKAWLVLSLTFAVAVTSALGQDNWTWTLDENGNASLTDPFGSPPILFPGLGVLAPEPISGMTTLFYPLGAILGIPTTPGDVLLREPGAPTNTFSDLLRFNQNGDVWFFSDRETNEITADLADVFVMPQPLPGAVSILEIGPEGNNGALYIPSPTQPGGDAAGFLFPDGLAYNIISDVPEPASLSLAALGGAAWLFFRRQRRGVLVTHNREAL